MSAIASSRRAAVRSVPETGGAWPAGSTWAPSDRGKNSYHDPYSARSRSTCTVSARDRVTSSRSGHRARMAAMAGSSDPASRSRGVSRRSRSSATSARSAVRAAAGRSAPGGWRDPPRGPLEQQRALGEHQLHVLAGRDLDRRVVVPAARSGRPTPPRGSATAPRRSRSRPRRSGRCRARARASARPGLPGLRPGSRSTTPTPMMPCPSRNTVALTSKVSPATALAGRRPQSTAGSRSRIGIRPITLVTLPIDGAVHASAGQVYQRRAAAVFSGAARAMSPLFVRHNLNYFCRTARRSASAMPRTVRRGERGPIKVCP